MNDPMEQIDNISLAKYQMAGNIASKVIENLINMINASNVIGGGISVHTLCVTGDKLIIEELGKVYPAIKNKGIAFPTCISLNNILGCYSPVDSTVVIKKGDLVKIELGVHIDGYPSCMCQTIDLFDDYNEDKDRVMKAVDEASKLVLKNMKITRTNKDIVKIIREVAEKYNCHTPIMNEHIRDHVPGLVIYQMSRNIIDGYTDEDKVEFVHRFMIVNEGQNDSIRELELEENEIYAIDIVMSSGTGKVNYSNYETTLFKKWQYLEQKPELKLKASKGVINSMGRNPFPITLRNIKDPTFKFGMKECVDKKIVETYPVMTEKEGIYVARSKFTVIITNDKPILIAGQKNL